MGKFKKSFIIISFILAFVFSFLPFEKAMAGASDNVSGWAWSENIGWISFNSSNCDSDDDGSSDDVNFSNCPVGQPVADYGVSVDLAGTGDFSGYAWSENIGWISFEPASVVGCPSGSCQANLNASNEVTGWARACSVFQSGCSGALASNLGGWDGWIHLQGANYQVVYNSGTKELSGFAFGDGNAVGVFGWISFNCIDTGLCANPYKVVISGGGGVEEPYNLTVSSANSLEYCGKINHAPVRLMWDVKSGITQDAYEVQVSTVNNNFSLPFLVHSEVGGSSQSCAPSEVFDYNTTYYWRVRITDDLGAQSDWSAVDSFTTISSPYPNPDFSWSPKRPLAGESIQFTNSTIGGSTYTWDFNDGTPFSSVINPIHTFTSPNPSGYLVNLSAGAVIDGSNRVCSVEKNLTVISSPPIWKETRPPIK